MFGGVVVSLAERFAKHQERRTLIVDIERLKGTFCWNDRYDGLTISGEFWGLSDFKRKFGRIPYTAVTMWPRTICAAWRWFGESKIGFAAEWQPGGPAKFAETMRDLLDEADAISGHHVNGFDRRHLNTLFRDHELHAPSPYKVMDTLTTARRELGDESMTLDALCQRYKIPAKQGHYDAEVAKAAVAGNKTAQRNIKSYNCADVEASTGLLAVMLPLVKGQPHAAPIAGIDRTLCPRCGSDDIQQRGTYSPAVLVYSRYLCRNCEGWFRGTTESRGPSVRAL